MAAYYNLITAAIQPRFRAIQPRYNCDSERVPQMTHTPQLVCYLTATNVDQPELAALRDRGAVGRNRRRPAEDRPCLLRREEDRHLPEGRPGLKKRNADAVEGGHNAEVTFFSGNTYFRRNEY